MAAKRNNKLYKNRENMPMEGFLHDYSPEEISEIIKCNNDIIYFAENYFYIVTGKGKGKIPLFQKQKEILKSFVDNRFNVLLSSRQTGKQLDIRTPIITPNGWTTMGELKTGDYVFDEKGTPTKILVAHPIHTDKKCYELEFDNGEKIIADANHDWFTQDRNERRRNCSGSKKNTETLFNKVITGVKKEPFHRIPICETINFTTKELIVAPYILGHWLKNDHSGISNVTFAQEDADGSESFLDKLKKLNVLDDKHIPIDYLQSSVEQRWELLRGLLGDDGSRDKKSPHCFTSIKLTLIENIRELCISLGIKCKITTKIPSIEKKTGRHYYRINITTSPKPSKLSNSDNKNRNCFHYIKKITPVESVPVRCISVEAESEMFLCGKTCIPTKNSSLMTIYCLWYALFNNDKLICYAANKESTAKELFGRIKLAYEQLPNWLKSALVTNNEKTIQFSNGSKIVTAATSETTFRGFSIHVLCLDEFAFVEPGIASAFYNSVMPAISSFDESKCIMVSTPNGASGLFYDTYMNAKNGTSEEGVVEWIDNEMHWSHFPGRDERWKNNMMALINHDEVRWNQEFNNVFIDTGVSALNMDLINLWMNRCSKIKPLLVEYGDSFKTYQKFDPSHCYVFGVDTSKGLGSDSHCIQILDITDLQNIIQVAIFENNTIPINVFTNILYEILNKWGSPWVLIENFGPGEACIELLKVHYQYEFVINYKRPDKTQPPDFHSENGINTKSNTKLEALNNFKYYSEYLSALEINDYKTAYEFSKFKKMDNGTYKAHGTEKDDRVMAILWALYILETDLANNYLDVAAYDESGKVMSLIHKKNKTSLESFFGRSIINENPIYTNNAANTGANWYQNQGFTFV